MQAFSALIDGLIYTRSRDHKVRLIADYLRSTPDPDRGWALAALAGTLSIATVKAAAIRAMAEALASGQRRGLLTMATGTGKTRTAIALVELQPDPSRSHAGHVEDHRQVEENDVVLGDVEVVHHGGPAHSDDSVLHHFASWRNAKISEIWLKEVIAKREHFACEWADLGVCGK